MAALLKDPTRTTHLFIFSSTVRSEAGVYLSAQNFNNWGQLSLPPRLASCANQNYRVNFTELVFCRFRMRRKTTTTTQPSICSYIGHWLNVILTYVDVKFVGNDLASHRVSSSSQYLMDGQKQF